MCVCASYEGVIASSCSDYCAMIQHVLSLLSIVLACTDTSIAQKTFPQRLACPQLCVGSSRQKHNGHINECIEIVSLV